MDDMPGITILPVRWQARIDVTNAGCWKWTGALSGYRPIVRLGRTSAMADRAIRHLILGDIVPRPGLNPATTLRRTCGEDLCVNPYHSEIAPASLAKRVAGRNSGAARSKVAPLEARVAELRAEVAELQTRLAELEAAARCAPRWADGVNLG